MKTGKKAAKPQRQQPAAAASPPDGLTAALDALEALQATGAGAKPLELPEAVRTCLDTVSAKERPKRVATLPIEIAEALVEAHAKTMSGKCGKCADKLVAKFWELTDAKQAPRSFGNSAIDDAKLLLLTCARKSPRSFWIQPQPEGARHLDGAAASRACACACVRG